MFEHLLPIGSVVRLKNANRELLVFGILQKHPSHDQQFDYIAVPYPEGFFDPRLQIAFNHGQIESILFRGFEDDKHKAFRHSLELLGQLEKEHFEKLASPK